MLPKKIPEDAAGEAQLAPRFTGGHSIVNAIV